MTKNFLETIADYSDRLRTVERQTAPTISTDQADALVDNQITQGVTYYTISSTTDPNVGFSISDTGQEWLNPNTSVIQWWDGLVWRSGAFPYQNNMNLTMWAARPLVSARTFFDVTEAASAPVSPGNGDVWTNTGVVKLWNGSVWVTITDSVANAVIAAAQAAYGVSSFRVFCQSATPVALANGNYWIDTDDWKVYVYSDSWNYIPIPGDFVGVILTASKFQTSEYGQRMELSSDTSAGVIKFWAGIDGEEPGYINPEAHDTGGSGIVNELNVNSGASGVPGANFDNPAYITLEAGSTDNGAGVSFAQLYTNAVINLIPENSPSINYGACWITYDGASGIDFRLNELIFFNNSGYQPGDTPTASNTQDVTAHDGTFFGPLHGSKVFADTPDSQAGSANIRFNANNQIVNATSLRETKEDIQPMTAEEAWSILNIEAVTYFDKETYKTAKEAGRELPRRLPGAIAEQVEEDAPLYADYNKDGLIGVAYDLAMVAFIPIIKNLQERVAKLEREQ